MSLREKLAEKVILGQMDKLAELSGKSRAEMLQNLIDATKSQKHAAPAGVNVDSMVELLERLLAKEKR